MSAPGPNPTFADIDADGDLDAFVGNSAGNLLFYRNTGTASNPVFAAPSTNPFGLTDVGVSARPMFADLDGDGDLDALIGNNPGNILFFRNNTPPTATNKTITLTEDSPYTFSSTDFGYADAEGSAMASVKVTSLPAAGLLKLNGTAVTLNQVIPTASIANLTYTPTANGNCLSYASFNFTVNDGKQSSILANAITLNVTAVNDAPTLTAFASTVASGNEDNKVTISFANLQTQGNEADVDGTTAFVVKTVSSGTLKIGLSAATATAWNASTNNTVDASHQAYWTPAANANGTVNAFTTVAKDNGGLESATPVQVQVNVTAVNDVPTFSVVGDGKVTTEKVCIIRLYR